MTVTPVLQAILVATFLSIPLSASAESFPRIIAGEARTGTTTENPNIFYLAGGAGSRVVATLTTPGLSFVTLFGPAGEKIHSGEGTDTVTFEVYLPGDDVYYLVAGSANAGQPYSLVYSEEFADFNLAYFSSDVGYNWEFATGTKYSVCWTIPGHQKKTYFSTGQQLVSTVGRHGFVMETEGQFYVRTKKHTFDGTDVVVRTEAPGKVDVQGTWSIFGRWASTARKSFNRYLCD